MPHSEDEAEQEDEGSTQADTAESSTCSSDPEDVVVVDLMKVWQTREDRDLARIEELAARLRPNPCVPLAPVDDPILARDASVMSGAKWPTAHCAFSGCGWSSERAACMDVFHVDNEWQAHTPRWQRRSRGTSACCGDRECLWEHLMQTHNVSLGSSEAQLARSNCLAAVAVRERPKCRRLVGRVGEPLGP